MVDEINKAHEDKSIHYLDLIENVRPKYKRYEELQAIIKLNKQMTKQKEISEIRNFITVNKNEIINVLGNKCEICEFDFKPILIIHHIKPISKGGGNNLDNLSVLCPNCHSIVHYLGNKNKSSKFINEWFDENVPPKKGERILALKYPEFYKRGGGECKW